MFNVPFRHFVRRHVFRGNKRLNILPAVYPTSHFERNEYEEIAKKPFNGKLHLLHGFQICGN